MAFQNGRMAPPQGWCHKGPQTDQDPPWRMEIPGSPLGRWMVDQQGRHLWHGECPDLLGPDGCSAPSVGVPHLSTGRLGLCLCGWLLLAFEENSGGVLDNLHPAISSGDWLSSQLEEDGHWFLQHVAGLHCDTQPTIGEDGTSKTWLGHVGPFPYDGQWRVYSGRVG